MRVLPISITSANSPKAVQYNRTPNDSVSFGTGFVRADSKKTAQVVEIYGQELNRFVLDAIAFYKEHIGHLEPSDTSLHGIRRTVTRDGQKFTRSLSYGYRNNGQEKFIRVADHNSGTSRASVEFDDNGQVVFANIEGPRKSIVCEVKNRRKEYQIMAEGQDARWTSEL